MRRLCPRSSLNHALTITARDLRGGNYNAMNQSFPAVAPKFPPRYLPFQRGLQITSSAQRQR
jgi:hypothetical protein